MVLIHAKMALIRLKWQKYGLTNSGKPLLNSSKTTGREGPWRLVFILNKNKKKCAEINVENSINPFYTIILILPYPLNACSCPAYEALFVYSLHDTPYHSVQHKRVPSKHHPRRSQCCNDSMPRYSGIIIAQAGRYA